MLRSALRASDYRGRGHLNATNALAPPRIQATWKAEEMNNVTMNNRMTAQLATMFESNNIFFLA
jgi:hypothetical protein